jgi:hypothetical protein
MKYFISLYIILTVLVPMSARADEALPSDAWAFLYEFPLRYTNGVVIQAESYRMTTGDASLLQPGQWSLEIVSEAGEQLRWYSFDPASLAVAGTFSLIVPVEYRGARAYVRDGAGVTAVAIDLRETRLCNDNGICNADAGEARENCPTDCGSAGTGTASILQQVSVGERVGGILLRLSSAVAGILLCIGVAQMLDRRRRS